MVLAITVFAVTVVTYLGDLFRVMMVVVDVRVSREEIEENLDCFQSKWGKKVYFLKIIDKGISPCGDWRSGYPPNIEGVNDLLIGLESKWIGLDG